MSDGKINETKTVIFFTDFGGGVFLFGAASKRGGQRADFCNCAICMPIFFST